MIAERALVVASAEEEEEEDPWTSMAADQLLSTSPQTSKNPVTIMLVCQHIFINLFANLKNINL